MLKWGIVGSQGAGIITPYWYIPQKSKILIYISAVTLRRRALYEWKWCCKSHIDVYWCHKVTFNGKMNKLEVSEVIVLDLKIFPLQFKYWSEDEEWQKKTRGDMFGILEVFVVALQILAFLPHDGSGDNTGLSSGWFSTLTITSSFLFFWIFNP